MAINWLRVCTRPGTLFVVLLLAGCSTYGPQLVLNSHIEYNKAVEQVIQEELLLNIVRRRYYEAPQFVTISSISSTMSTSTAISGGSAFGNEGTPTTGNIGGSVAFSDSPTARGGGAAWRIGRPRDAERQALLEACDHVMLVVELEGTVIVHQPIKPAIKR